MAGFQPWQIQTTTTVWPSTKTGTTTHLQQNIPCWYSNLILCFKKQQNQKQNSYNKTKGTLPWFHYVTFSLFLTSPLSRLSRLSLLPLSHLSLTFLSLASLSSLSHLSLASHLSIISLSLISLLPLSIASLTLACLSLACLSTLSFHFSLYLFSRFSLSLLSLCFLSLVEGPVGVWESLGSIHFWFC